MSTTAPQLATTPIPVQLSEPEFTAFILPHLSMPKRGPKCKLGYHRLFNLILWVLYTGMQWKCVPIPTNAQGNRPCTTPMSTERLPSGLTMGRSRTRSSRVWGRVEQTFAWEDKCKRLLLRCEHIQQRHVGMKLLAYILINLRAFCGVSNSQPVKYEPHLYRAEGM